MGPTRVVATHPSPGGTVGEHVTRLPGASGTDAPVSTSALTWGGDVVAQRVGMETLMLLAIKLVEPSCWAAYELHERLLGSDSEGRRRGGD